MYLMPYPQNDLLKFYSDTYNFFHSDCTQTLQYHSGNSKLEASIEVLKVSRRKNQIRMIGKKSGKEHGVRKKDIRIHGQLVDNCCHQPPLALVKRFSMRTSLLCMS